MRQALAIVALAVLGILAGLTLTWGVPWGGEPAASQGIVIVASVPGLAADVGELACPGDKITFIVPGGVDPHSYQLRPSDYSTLKAASLLVVVGGEALEDVLARKAGELGLEVFKAVDVEGVTLLKTPSGKVNVHYPIYDPRNYLAFMESLASRLAELNPGCAGYYQTALERIMREARGILSKEGSLQGFRAAASTTMVQYAVTWLGVEIVGYVVEDPEGQALPSSVGAIEGLLKTGSVDIAFIVVDSSGRPLTRADAWLSEKAAEAGIPVVGVEAPYLPGSTLSKLARLLGSLESLGLLGGS